MTKFVKIIINRKKQEYKNIHYLPKIIGLFEKYSKYLCDDYFFEDYDSIVDAVIDLIENTGPFFWAVIDKKNGEFTGFGFLENWVGSKNDRHSAEVTTCFEPEFWGKYTKICAKKFVNYCFKKYGLIKLKASIFPQNYRVKTLLNKTGFKKESLLKGETIKNGVLQDIEIYSIIKEKKWNTTKLTKI